MSTRNDLLQQILTAYETGGGGESPTKAYLGYEETTPIPLTTTPTIVSGFVETIAPIGFTQSGGRITVDDEKGGVYAFTIERIYQNGDTNPSAPPVQVTLDIQLNGAPAFTRTASMPTATSNDEPGILPRTSPIEIELVNGDYIEAYVSASDGGASPSDASLTLFRVTGYKIFAL